jgi:hypothetical protein
MTRSFTAKVLSQTIVAAGSSTICGLLRTCTDESRFMQDEGNLFKRLKEAAHVSKNSCCTYGCLSGLSLDTALYPHDYKNLMPLSTTF